MRNTLLTVFLSVLVLNGWGQVDKPIESTIREVTVFLNKAQVTRDATVRIESGKTNLILTGLTSSLDPQSIQVTGKGDFIILGISHQPNFINEFNVPKSLKALEDSVFRLQTLVALEQSQKETLNKEEQMLISNQKIGGGNQNLTVTELKNMAEFFRARLGDIANARIKGDERIGKINRRIIKLQQQIVSQNDLYSRNTSEIIVSVSAQSPITAEMKVMYVVTNAGWNAVYDLRAINTKKPIQLIYKANVFQNTGENWNNVKLKLSTANPNLSGLKPELNTWYLNFEESIGRMLSGKVAGVRIKKMEAAAPVMTEDDKAEEAQTSAAFVTTVQTSLNTEFDIALPYTVVSSVKPTIVDIRNYEMNASYLYSVAPKLDMDAFLLAQATGWEDFNLIPGEANIFFEGTFLGKTYIDPGSIKDTLSVSLGRDKRIVIKREKLKDLSSRKLIGTNQRESYAWEISIRNTKTEPVKIVVEDQVPVSQDSQIEVTVLDVAGAKYNKNNGKLAWEINLQPNENKKFVFKYEIKYPKGKTIM